MQATWEDDESNSSESDEEKAILCLMANEDEVNSNLDSSSECEMSYDDSIDAYNRLLDAFKELHDELANVGQEIVAMAEQQEENAKVNVVEEEEEEEEKEVEGEGGEQEATHDYQAPPAEESSLHALLLESITLSKEQIDVGKENREHILALRERVKEVTNEIDLVKHDLAGLRATELLHF
ncbi:uncharacterized protein LOC132270410 [Cornus florida]|uniref:uncharacterized protein LOC132270410 n=1 Tax=Cornus florida TaxID=4283 RepID=UPI0028A0406B|nr:uncharacterized protein LOC132270410 [Cornus florida]